MPQRRVGKGAAGIVDDHPVPFGFHLGDRVGDAVLARPLARVECGGSGQAVVGRHAGIGVQDGLDAARRGHQQIMPVMGGRRSGEAAAKQQRDNHGKRMFHGSTLPSGT